MSDFPMMQQTVCDRIEADCPWKTINEVCSIGCMDGSHECDNNFQQGKMFRISLRLSQWFVVFIQGVYDWNLDRTDYDIQLCVLLATNNGLAATNDNPAYCWVRTLRQSWLIMGTQCNVHINSDWPTSSRLTRPAPENMDWATGSVCGRRI